jgi:hypothetical protein
MARAWFAVAKDARSGQEGLTFGSTDEGGRTSLGSAEIVGDALTLSTNSRERAKRGRDLRLHTSASWSAAL